MKKNICFSLILFLFGSARGQVPLVARFSASPTNGVPPLTVTFTDSSSFSLPITNRFWNFGDGASTNTLATNLVHIYTAPGSNTVTLTVMGTVGSATLSITNFIIVANVPALLSVNPPNLNYGSVIVNQTSVQNFVIGNGGGQELTATIATSFPFSLFGGSSLFSVGPGITALVPVAFSPPTAGNFSNVVVFTSNGGFSTNVVTGFGVFSTNCAGTFLTNDPGGLLSGFESNSLPPSFNNVSAGPVRTCVQFCFCGTLYSNVWINNDGNVTLDGPFDGRVPPAPVPSPRLADLQRPIFAPFWADVDTTTTGSGTVGWGCGCGFAGPGVGWRPAFGVTWRNVGYYRAGADKANSFQMLIIDRSDRGQGSFDLQYRYASVQWDTADSAFGRGGACDLGAGFPARVGYASGTSCAPVELTGSGACGALLDTGGSALIKGSLGQGPAGVYTWQFTNCFAPNGP